MTENVSYISKSEEKESLSFFAKSLGGGGRNLFQGITTSISSDTEK